jgi:hypothetical protein
MTLVASISSRPSSPACLGTPFWTFDVCLEAAPLHCKSPGFIPPVVRWRAMNRLSFIARLALTELGYAASYLTLG